MYSTLFCLALLTATAAPAVFATFAINDPTLTQCQSITLSWSKGTPPYDLVVVDANDPCGDPIFEFNNLTSTVFDWLVEVPENAIVQFYVEDAGDVEDAWSNTLTVGASNDASCLTPSVLSYFNMTAPPTDSNTGDKTNGSSPPSSGNNSTGLVPVGAANAGTNPLDSGASSSMRQGTPTALLITIFAATIALAF